MFPNSQYSHYVKVECKNESDEASSSEEESDIGRENYTYSPDVTDLQWFMTLQRENRSDILEVNKRVLEVTELVVESKEEVRSILETMRDYVDEKTLQVQRENRREISSLTDRVQLLEAEATLRKNQVDNSSRSDAPRDLDGQQGELILTANKVNKGNGNPPGDKTKNCQYCGKLLAKSYVRRHESSYCKKRTQ